MHEQSPKQSLHGSSKSMACCNHLIDAGIHAVNHFYGTRTLEDAVHAHSNIPSILLHLDDANVIHSRQSP